MPLQRAIVINQRRNVERWRRSSRCDRDDADADLDAEADDWSPPRHALAATPGFARLATRRARCAAECPSCLHDIRGSSASGDAKSRRRKPPPSAAWPSRRDSRATSKSHEARDISRFSFGGVNEKVSTTLWSYFHAAVLSSMSASTCTSESWRARSRAAAELGAGVRDQLLALTLLHCRSRSSIEMYVLRRWRHTKSLRHTGFREAAADVERRRRPGGHGRQGRWRSASPSCSSAREGSSWPTTSSGRARPR